MSSRAAVAAVQAAFVAGVEGRRESGFAWETWHHPTTGKYHRLEGPAIVDAQPATGQFWYVAGFLHREDGPAEVTVDYVRWRVYGVIHRTDGPATQFADGGREWVVDGREVDDSGARDELNRLYDAAGKTAVAAQAERERLQLVLSMWTPSGLSVVELSAAVAAARA